MSSHNYNQPQAAAIVAHYRRKGYSKQELRRVVERHVRLLSVLDPEAAGELESTVLFESARDRYLAEHRACVAAYRRRHRK
jgi:hypothetical protein